MSDTIAWCMVSFMGGIAVAFLAMIWISGKWATIATEEAKAEYLRIVRETPEPSKQTLAEKVAKP